MPCSSPVPPSSSLSSAPTPTPEPSPSPPSSPLSPPPSSPLSPLSPMPPFSFSAHHSPLSLSASNPPALRSGTTDATTPESTGSPLTPVDSLPTAPPCFPERASEVPSSQLSDLLARLAPELITPPRLPPHLAPWLKSPTTPPPQHQTSPKTPNSYALPTVPDGPQDPVFSGRSPETPTRISIPILALEPPPDWSGPWDAAKGAREIKWLLPEKVDDDEEPAIGEEGDKSRMIRAAHRSLEINGARLNELESTLDVMMEHISTLEDKITKARIQRNGMKRFLKGLKGQCADQTDLESERGESGDCRDASTGGEQMVAKRKAGEVLSSSDGEGHKAGRFKIGSSSSAEVSEIPTKGKYDDEYILSDEDMKDRGLFDGISGSKAEPQIEGDMTIAGAANKTGARRATEFVDGNVDGKETPQPPPKEQKRPKPKYNLRSRGGESSKAGGAGAAQTREKTETGTSMRDRWAYEAGVEHSTFSSMRRDGAAE
ncbi:hypothetical protein DFP73DRAFT_527758 [Morchella snyderi]|nr:hypothetical protein DFP73DRAFT_527758 [Morchella snyderi]